MLDFRNNRLTDECVIALFRALKFNTSIHTVDLRWNSVSDMVVDTVVDTLMHNKTVDALQLSGNSLHNTSMQRIDRALLRQPPLEPSATKGTAPQSSNTPLRHTSGSTINEPISPLPGPRSHQQRHFDTDLNSIEKRMDEQDRRLALAGGERQTRGASSAELDAAKKDLDSELQAKADTMVVDNARYISVGFYLLPSETALNSLLRNTDCV